VLADGFFEWRKVLGGKIPYNIQMKNGRPFVFAGLWEGWKPPQAEDWIRYVDCRPKCSTEMKHLN